MPRPSRVVRRHRGTWLADGEVDRERARTGSRRSRWAVRKRWPVIRGMIFDIDGTLVDSVDLHARAWQETFRHFGHEIPYDRVRAQIGKGGDQLMPALLPEDVVRDRGEQIEAYRGDHYKRVYLPEDLAFPSVRELFERLRADGKRLALASSARGDELEAYNRITRVGDLIEAESSSDDAERSKPHPDIFQAALGRLGGLGPDEVLVVGDTPYDAEAAAKAGIRTVGMTCGGWP
ncbi:Phosphoglycolate phosphatase (plasmid) [Tautonia plasticadhaerens]|uniref:Phosphoglycolate phosphatase n=1 Tax=Tautonia plasticadhaerens TaxID=2527974 RepID=A0A518HFH9_9BACT|nr:Phosphoglycolate phosphatase [Tautonia plasticadhaerens]